MARSIVMFVFLATGLCSTPEPLTAIVEAVATQSAKVGGPVELVVAVKNTGPSIPHLAFVFRTPDRWYERRGNIPLRACAACARPSVRLRQQPRRRSGRERLGRDGQLGICLRFPLDDEIAEHDRGFFGLEDIGALVVILEAWIGVVLVVCIPVGGHHLEHVILDLLRGERAVPAA